MAVTPDKSMLQVMGFSFETGANCSNRKKKSKAFFLDYFFCIHFFCIHSSTASLMREGTDSSVHAYASGGGRESNRILAFSRSWDKLGPLQLDMEDDIVNLIGVQWGLGDIPV